MHFFFGMLPLDYYTRKLKDTLRRIVKGSELHMYSAGEPYTDRTAVYLQCPAVHTADTLQHMECTCSGGCKYTSAFYPCLAYTLHVHCTCTLVKSGYAPGLSTIHTAAGQKDKVQLCCSLRLGMTKVKYVPFNFSGSAPSKHLDKILGGTLH